MITEFYIPTKIISGAGSFRRLGREAAGYGSSALLVTGKTSARKSGLLQQAVADLEKNGISTTVFDSVESNPRASTVDEGAALVRSKDLDLVIALGGGSAMDAAKGIVIAAIGGKPVAHYFRSGESVSGERPKLITVPTVAASGSEANCGAVITDWESHEKCVVGEECSYPAVSIVDPELTLTLPAKPTAQGGVDILCHLIEPYVTTGHPRPLTDGIMETTMGLVVECLPRVLKKPDYLEGRSELSWASTIACSAFAGLGGGDGAMTMHGIEHPLSGYYDMAHGDGLAALLPTYLESLAGVRAERIAKLGRNVFGGRPGIEAVRSWLKSVDMELRLRELGVEQDRLAELADNAIRTAPWLSRHPVKLDRDAISAIYRAAW
jgi:alcohol dehydrogenase class IV